MNPSDQITDELATVLFALDGRQRTTGAMTSLITRSIVEWAQSHGWSVRTEARVHPPPKAPVDSTIGFVDVVVRRGGDEPDLAIEIDSADKPWSVTKLQHAVEGGMHAIWVRWGDDAWAGIYDDVHVIQLPALRRPQIRRSTSGQLTLWS